MELQTYTFEAGYSDALDVLVDGQPQIGQSRLLEQQDDPNRVHAYAQLHLGEVAGGAQAVVYYERGDTTGVATFERTATTDGLHDWHMNDTQMTAQGPQIQEHKDITVATEDSDGFMNRHMFLRPGDTLAMITAEDAARVKTLGTIMAVHLIGIPHQPLKSAALVPVSPNAAKEFAKAA